MYNLSLAEIFLIGIIVFVIYVFIAIRLVNYHDRKRKDREYQKFIEKKRAERSMKVYHIKTVYPDTFIELLKLLQLQDYTHITCDTEEVVTNNGWLYNITKEPTPISNYLNEYTTND